MQFYTDPEERRIRMPCRMPKCSTVALMVMMLRGTMAATTGGRVYPVACPMVLHVDRLKLKKKLLMMPVNGLHSERTN